MREPRRGNLLAGGMPAGDDELIEVLMQGQGVRIERIVSTGQASPPGFWYDQSDDEFVVLLDGAAELRFEEGDRRVSLVPGDWIEIPAPRPTPRRVHTGRSADRMAGGAPQRGAPGRGLTRAVGSATSGSSGQ